MIPQSKCRWLVLVPTEFELESMRAFWPNAFDKADVVVDLCGFGPIAAAARAAELISRFRPLRVLLLGIAGSYADDLEVGSACLFKHVGCYGIGVGSGEHFESAESLGWQQWYRDDDPCQIGEVLELEDGGNREERALVTCTSASNNMSDVELRKSAFTHADAEDMEGFAVALACELASVSHRYIIRGISNRAGDRDKENWNIDKALMSACELADAVVSV